MVNLDVMCEQFVVGARSSGLSDVVVYSLNQLYDVYTIASSVSHFLENCATAGDVSVISILLFPVGLFVLLFRMIVWKAMFIDFGFVELGNQVEMVAAYYS
ncbi:hypothetical protein ACET3Z_026933 [Daucus carota]